MYLLVIIFIHVLQNNLFAQDEMCNFSLIATKILEYSHWETYFLVSQVCPYNFFDPPPSKHHFPHHCPQRIKAFVYATSLTFL